MVKVFKFRRMVFAFLALLALACVFAPVGYAATAGAAVGGDIGIGAGLKALGLAVGAGIAIAGAGMGTGRAQGGVGAAGAGAIAEKPESFGSILILFAIPETVVILGFVIAYLLYAKIV